MSSFCRSTTCRTRRAKRSRTTSRARWLSLTPTAGLQFGEDLELFFRTLIGTGSNPNVAACVVIGIEPGWTGRIVDGIAKTGKPVEGFAIEGHGDITTIASTRRARHASSCSGRRRSSASRARSKQLFISTKCGESDTTSGLASCPTVGNLIDKLDPLGVTTCFGETSELTGAEIVCASRAANPEVGTKFMRVFNAYQAVIERHKTDDLSESQPTKGNISGGLTTIEEKAFGNLQKIGRKAQFIDVLKPAEAPAKGPGLYYMDTSSAAAECVTLQAAAGFVVHLFPTGQGNVIGNPIEPVIKLTANPKTARTMSEHIDLDVSGILRREMTLDQAGDRADRDRHPDVQRPPHVRRGAGPSRVRPDQAVSKRVRRRGPHDAARTLRVRETSLKGSPRTVKFK